MTITEWKLNDEGQLKKVGIDEDAAPRGAIIVLVKDIIGSLGDVKKVNSIQFGKRITSVNNGWVVVKTNHATNTTVIHLSMASDDLRDKIFKEVKNKYKRTTGEGRQHSDEGWAVVEVDGEIFVSKASEIEDEFERYGDYIVHTTGIGSEEEAQAIAKGERDNDWKGMSKPTTKQEYTTKASVSGTRYGRKNLAATIRLYDDGRYEFTNEKTGEKEKAYLSALVVVQDVGDDIFIPHMVTDDKWNPGFEGMSDVSEEIRQAFRENL